MRIRRLIWSDLVVDKLDQKHDVFPEEVSQACHSRHYAVRGRKGVYYVYGRSDEGRYLFVVLADRGNRCYKVVTARDMTRAERQLFKRRAK